jgi:hypothetical protein
MMFPGEHLPAHDEIMRFSASTTPLEFVHYQCTTHMVEKAERKRFSRLIHHMILLRHYGDLSIHLRV